MRCMTVPAPYYPHVLRLKAPRLPISRVPLRNANASGRTINEKSERRRWKKGGTGGMKKKQVNIPRLLAARQLGRRRAKHMGTASASRWDLLDTAAPNATTMLQSRNRESQLVPRDVLTQHLNMQSAAPV